jgi:hypothetical protein
MLAVIHRAQAGDADAVPALQKILDRVPELRTMLGADLERIVEESIIRSLGGDDNLAFREGLKRKLAALRRELEGASPTPIERLLVDRVVACWLQVQEADLRYAQARGQTLPQANYVLKRQDSAHRRFLLALRTLEMVRKLALPSLQVNIGANQVNVGNALASDAE